MSANYSDLFTLIIYIYFDAVHPFALILEQLAQLNLCYQEHSAVEEGDCAKTI